MEDRLKTIEETWTLQSESFYREKESMLQEVLSFYQQAETKEDKKKVVDCLSKWNTSMSLLHSAVTALVEFLLNNVDDLLNGSVSCISQLISIPSLKHYLKQNEKKCTELFKKIAQARKPGNEETALILNNLLAIGLSTEKGISTFLKTAHPSLAIFFTHLEGYKHLDDAKKQTFLILKTLFNKTATQKLKQTLRACFTDEDEGQKYLELFQSLRNCCESNVPVNAKITYFKFIFQALLHTPQLEDLEILQFFSIISFLLGVPRIGDSVRIEEILRIHPNESLSNLPIWTGVVETVSKRPVNLNLEVSNTTFLQWFKTVAVSLIKAEEFGVVQVDALTALAQLDSSIIEQYLAKIFTKLFTEEFLKNEEGLHSYQKFLLTTLTIFSRLQRTEKLLKRLLSAVAASLPTNSTQELLFDSFLDQLGKNFIVISSSQALSLINFIIDQFQKCIKSFQEDELNAALLDAVGLLFCTLLTNCRLICSSLPRSVVEQFTQIIDNFKESLGLFGTLILLRTHDRKIMQPFLRICHVWGEYRVLVDLYASESGPLTLTNDATPSDLSPILPFLKVEQWNILSERIANFGDKQCNQLFMKLLILKIRVANLSNDRSAINLEAIAKYILESFKQNVHGLKIDETFSAEEFGFVFNALPAGKEKTLLKIFYQQIVASDDAIFESWIKSKNLLENPKFVELMFEIAIREISEDVPRKDFQQLLKSCNLKSVSEDLKTSINAVLRETSGYTENKLNDRVRKSLTAITSLPLGYIASFGDNPLVIVLGIMTALNSTHLLPVFEKLLSYSKTLSNSFDISACIHWLTVHVNRALRGPIIEQLVVKSTMNETGIKTLKQLIKNLESDSRIEACEKLATQIHLHNAIRKCWRQGSDPEITQINDVIAKQRKKLNKSLHSALENAADIANDCVLLDAYGIELMRLEREGKIEGIVALNFQSYLDKALVGVKQPINSPEHQSCLNFLTTVLKCSSALRQATGNQNFVFVVYKKLMGFESPVLWEHVCAAASDKEFQNIMKDVSTNVQLGLCLSDSWECHQVMPDELKPLVMKYSGKNSLKRWSDHYINVWKLFLKKSTGEKQKCCYNHLKLILGKVENLLPRAGRNHSESLLKWMRFLHYVVNLSILTIRPELEDYVMDAMMAFPESGTDFQDHFIAQLNIIGALIAPQKIPAVRKMHMIFLVYQKLVRWLSRESDANGNLSADNVSSRALAAFHLEKWIGLLAQRKDEFLVFPLYITELINFIANVTVYPPVKVHVRNAVFHLLAVMDEQQVRVVSRNLNTGCQQIFNSLHSEFVKFHKYKGKI